MTSPAFEHAPPNTPAALATVYTHVLEFIFMVDPLAQHVIVSTKGLQTASTIVGLSADERFQAIASSP